MAAASEIAGHVARIVASVEAGLFKRVSEHAADGRKGVDDAHFCAGRGRGWSQQSHHRPSVWHHKPRPTATPLSHRQHRQV